MCLLSSSGGARDRFGVAGGVEWVVPFVGGGVTLDLLHRRLPFSGTFDGADVTLAGLVVVAFQSDVGVRIFKHCCVTYIVF